MKFYLDEDISPRVAALLRQKGVDAVSAHDVQMIGASDGQQLVKAASEGRAMVTRNRNDFIALTVLFFQDGKVHCGLLIVPHTIQGHHFGLLARRLEVFAERHPAGMAPYTIEFLAR